MLIQNYFRDGVIGQSWKDLFTRPVFAKNAQIIIICYCFSAALSIALSQALIITLLVYWLLMRTSEFWRLLAINSPDKECDNCLANTTNGCRAWNLFAAPVICWFLVSLFASLFGINVTKAIIELCKTSVYLFFPFCIFDICKSSNLTFDELISRLKLYILSLTAGQSIAAIHSVIFKAIGSDARYGVPGPVTESGQLALIIPSLIGLLVIHFSELQTDREKIVKRTIRTFVLRDIFLFFSLLLLAWPKSFFPEQPKSNILLFQWLATGAVISILATSRVGFISLFKRGVSNLPRPGNPVFGRLLGISLALFFAVLLINLKRGPWLGVLLSLAIFGSFFSRRLVAMFLILALGLVSVLGPARDRFLAISADFFIYGGRRNMWAIGMELVHRYPLGIGLDNASYMRALDPTLPYVHRHMHNNLLNVAVESGLIGLCAYLWWMVTIIGIGYLIWRKFTNLSKSIQQARILALALSSAIISWQTAGLVEYNFGDGEVRMIAFFFMGLLISLYCAIRKESSLIKSCANSQVSCSIACQGH